MRKLLLSLVLAFSFIPSANAVAPSDINAATIPGNLLFSDGGVSTNYLYGPFVRSVSVIGNSLSIIYQDPDSALQTLVFTPAAGGEGGMADGFVASGSFNSASQELVLTLSTGSEIDVDLAELTTAAELSSAITTALAGYALRTELPAANELVPETGTTGYVLTKTASGRDWAPSGGGSDGVVTGGTVSAGVLTLTRSGGLDPLMISGIGGGEGGSDGVLQSATFNTASKVLTLTLSTGVTVTADLANLATSTEITTAITDAVEPWARIGTSDTIPDARIPSAIARDSELPGGNLLLPTGGVPGQVVTKTAGSREWATVPGDGRVDSGEVTGTTLTLRRNNGLADVTITGLPQAGEATNDGVLTGASILDHSLLLQRSQGLSDVVAEIPFEVVAPDADGILRNAIEADYTNKRIAIDHTNLRVATRAEIEGVSVSFANYADSPNYRGAYTYATLAPSPVNGNYAYGTLDGVWCLFDQNRWHCSRGTPSNWRGAYNTQESAEAHVRGINDITYWRGAGTVRRVTSFSSENYAYEWQPEQERLQLLSSPRLPDPSTANAGQYAKINTAGDAYETGALAIPETSEEIVHVLADDVSFVGGDVNAINLANAPAVAEGLIYQFFSEGVNTGEVRVHIGTENYVVFKSAELGAFEVFEGGELTNTQPVQLTYSGGSLWWTGTLLGNAAGKDIGLFEGEIPIIQSYGHLATSAVATDGTNYQILTRVPGVPGHEWRDDRSVVPIDSPSFPQITPDFTGQLAANKTGHLYVGVEERVSHLNDPTWNTALLSTVIPAPPNETFILYRGVTDQDLQFGTVPVHSFWFDPTFHYWQLRSNPNVGLTWPQVVDYFRANPSSTDNAPTDFLPLTGHKSYFLQGPETAFTSDLEAAKYAVVHGVNDRTARSYVFFVGTPSNSDTWVLRLAQRTAYMEGTHSVLVERHWEGPVQDGSVVDGSVDEATGIMTLGRSEGDPITVANVNDGVVISGAYGTGVVTLQRSRGLPDIAIGGFPSIPTPGQSLGSAFLRYTAAGNSISWQRGAFRGAWNSTTLYFTGDSVTNDGSYWVALNQVLNIEPNHHQSTRWARLTSNVDYLGDLVPVPYEYQNGHIVHQGGHYYLRVGGAGNLAPNAAPGEWVQLDGHAETDSACGVRSHFEQGTANRLATVTTGAITDPTDTPMFTIQYAPQSINSRIYISMYANLEAEDDADTEEETRYIYSLYHGPGSGETFGVAKGVLRHTSGDGISEYDHTLSIQYVHHPATTNDTTYSFRLQRRQTGTEAPMEVRVAAYSIHVLDLGDPNASCDVRLETIPVKKDNVDVVLEPTALDFTSFLSVTDDTGIARITPRFDPLDLISSTDLADTDLLVAQDISDGNSMKKLTVGSLADELSDGTTTVSGGGLISVPFDNFLPNDLHFAVVGSILTGTITMPGRADLVESVTLPAGGGGGGGVAVSDPLAFKAVLTGLARDSAQTTYTQSLQIDASDIVINDGFFGLEEGTGGTDTTERIIIPQTGVYFFIANIHFSLASGVGRSEFGAQVTVERGGTETDSPEIFAEYNRGTSNNDGGGIANTASFKIATVLDLEAGDRIGLKTASVVQSRTFTIDGPSSFVSLTRAAAAQGAGGEAGISFQDEGTEIAGDLTTLNCVGEGITCTGATDTLTVTVPGGAGGMTDPFEGITDFGGSPADNDRILMHDVSSMETHYESFLQLRGHISPDLRDEGTNTSNVGFNILNFTGDGVTCTQPNHSSLATCNVPGSTGGGGITGIRIEEGGNIRVASADALDFNINDFAINIVQDPEAGVSIAAALTRDTEIADAFEAVSVAGNQLTFTQIDGDTTDVTISSFDLHRDVTTEGTTIADSDRFIFSDENQAGDPMRYLTAVNLFDSFRDIASTGITTVIQADDRMFLTDENVAGDPMRFTTVWRLFDAQRDVINETIATLQTDDRMYVSDEGEPGDPMRYIELGDLQTFFEATASSFDLHRDVPTQYTRLSDADRFVVTDEGETDDPMRYISALRLFDSVRDLIDSSISTPLQNDDRMFLSDEDVAGDPMRYVELGDLQTFFGATAVIANPGTASTSYLDDITIGTTDFEIRGDPTKGQAPITVSEILNIENRMFMTEFLNAVHTPKFVSMGTFRRNVITHQGGYDTTRAYQLGAVVFTGTGEDLTYWITADYVPAGSDAPNFSEPGPWYHLGHRATYYGDFGTQDAVVDFYQGSSFLYNDEFYFVTGNNLDTSISDLIAGTDVVQISDPFRHRGALSTEPADDDKILIEDVSDENTPKTRTWEQMKDDVLANSFVTPSPGALIGTYTNAVCPFDTLALRDSGIDLPATGDWFILTGYTRDGFWNTVLLPREVFTGAPTTPVLGTNYQQYGVTARNVSNIGMGQNSALLIQADPSGNLLFQGPASHNQACSFSLYRH